MDTTESAQNLIKPSPPPDRLLKEGHIQPPMKKRCWSCNGNGIVSVVVPNKCWDTKTCPDCNGTGKRNITKCKETYT